MTASPLPTPPPTSDAQKRRTRVPDRLTDAVVVVTVVFAVWAVGLVAMTLIGIAKPAFYYTDQKAALKAVGATVVVILSAGQAWTMYSAMGKLPRGGIRIRTLMRLHRYGGRITIALAAVIAVFCMVDIGAPTDPLRVAIHVVFGAAAFSALALKFTLIRFRPALAYDLAPWLGGAAAVAFTVIWVSSAVAYFTGRL
jgi:hypothetical protein